MKKVLLFTVAAVLILQVSAAFAAKDDKFAVINTALIYSETLAGQHGEKQVKGETDKLRTAIEKGQEEYKALVEDFKKKEAALSLESRRLQEIEIKRKQDEIKQLALAFRQADQEARQKFLPEINTFLEKYATEYLDKQGYTMVIDANRGALAFFKKEYEVSKDVIKYCDKKWKSEGRH